MTTQQDILNFLNDGVTSSSGKGDFAVSGFSMLDGLKPNTVTFVKNPAFVDNHEFRANVLYMLPSSLAGSAAQQAIYVDDPRLNFIRCLNKFFTPAKPVGIHPTAIIGQNVSIGNNCFIGPYCVIEDNCTVGSGCTLNAHVHLYSNVSVGNNVIIHGGTVIGADGFGYQRNPDGQFEKFPHFGGVVIEDDVEIGGRTCVDRGTLGNTIIRRGAKIDNLVHIAHNVDVGEDSAVIALAMVGGSVKMGKQCWVGPSASIINQVTLGDNVLVGVAANVIRNVEPNTVVAGNPAKPIVKKSEA